MPRNPLPAVRRPVAVVASLLAAAGLFGFRAQPVRAQPAGLPENPVFVNESIAAGEALARARENLASGNIDQAVRLLQRVLDDDATGGAGAPPSSGTHAAGGLVQSSADPMLYLPVRAVVHQLLQSDAALLERYRASQDRQAADDLAAGRIRLVEHCRLLTAAGLEAALALAGEEVEASQFWAAWHTLVQLKAHPDAQDGTAKGRAVCQRATRMALTIAAYLDSAWVSAEARAWAQRAGLNDAAPGRIAGPNGPRVISPLTAQAVPSIEALVSRPVVSAAFASRDASGTSRGGGANGRTTPESLPPSGRDLRIMPSLCADTVVVPSPRGITAFDRLTLNPRWRLDARTLLGLEPDPDEQEANQLRGRGGLRTYDDVASAAVRGPWVVAGISGESRDEEQDLVAAIDGPTGRVRWTKWSGQIDPALFRARLRGPIVLEGDLAIVSFRKELRERRLGAALYLAGLSLDDGSTRWTSLVGSIGALPFTPSAPATDGGLISDGVYLRSDRMGLLAAYVAGNGRPIWVRRFAGEVPGANNGGSSWHMQLPAVCGSRAVVLTPDRRQMVAVDIGTGGVAWRVDEQRTGQALYVLGMGESRLVLVNDDGVRFVDASEPATGPMRIARFEAPGIRGRAVVAGSGVLVPLVGGVAWINPDLGPDQPGSPEKPLVVPIDDSGSLLADSGQLLVADDSRLHSYLSWEAGDRLLSDRIKAAPTDAAAAIALTEFAYRAGRHERVLFAADAAVSALRAGAISAADLAEAVEPDRRRLLGALRTMIAASLRDNAASPPASGVLSPALLMGVLERFSAMARTSEETAAHHFYLGRAHERAGRFTDAVAVYQSVLASADLCAAMWQGERLGIRADAEATRRLETILASNGRAVYAAVDREFASTLAAAPQTASATDLEQIARRYPVAAGVPALWLRVAALYRLQDRPRAAARALEAGLQTAQRLPDATMPVVGELAGELVANLRERSLVLAAGETLREVRARFPGLALSRTGAGPIDSGTLAAELGRLAQDAHRWPPVGRPQREGIETFVGWTIVEPAIRPTLGVAPPALMLHHDDGRVMLLSSGREPDAPMGQVWSAPADADPAELVRMDANAALLYLSTPAGGVLQRVEIPTGAVAWRTRAFGTHFVGPEGGGAIVPGPRAPGSTPAQGQAADRIRVPLEGSRSAVELLVCTDNRSVALVERSGRAVAFDADAGSTLWAAGLPIARVFDCDVAGSVLAIAGERDVHRPDGSVSAATSILLIVDARTGHILHEIEPPTGQVRWLRLSSRGDLVVGCSGGLCSIDPETGQVNWLNADPLATGSLRAWTLGQSLLLVGSDRSLWSISFSTGTTRPVSLRRGEEESVRIETASEPQAYAIDNGALALCSPKGLLLIDRDGNVVGGDALSSEDTLVGPVPGDGLVVTLDAGVASRTPANDAGLVYALHILESGTGRLLSSTPLALGEPPAKLALLPGRIALTAGRTTVIYRAPAER